MMRRLVVGIAALLLAGCGGEDYPIAPTQAYLALSEIGTPSVMDPMPAGLAPVSVHFEALPGDNSVQWLFTHDGDDLGRIVAKVTPNGDAASTVTIDYVEGSAPDENWRNGSARGWIKSGAYRLVAEAVDAKMEKRSFDMAVRQSVAAEVAAASAGAMMQDASSAMDKAVERQKQAVKESESRAASNPYAATKPTTDLSKYN